MSLKSELKNGAVVKTRNGRMYVKVDDTLLNINMSSLYITLDIYLEDLKSKIDKNWDIVKVNNNTNNRRGYCNNAIEEVQRNKWTWERPAEILDEKEKEYLSAVIKPFRNKIANITKYEIDSESECIIIDIKRDVYIDLLNFEKNAMYVGMKLNKVYTLEELGL